MLISYLMILGGVTLWFIGCFYLGYMIRRLWMAIVILCIFGVSTSLLLKATFDDGEKRGAYKQLRGEYTLVYHVDDQGNICDTIIVEFK